MDPVPPPAYSALDDENFLETPLSPPNEHFPNKLMIGATALEVPLVTLRQVTGHLALLHAFCRLRIEVNELDLSVYPDIPALRTDEDKRWSWFVGVAVERFDKWCRNLQDGDGQNGFFVLPPLDVIMVWHTYMLNPRWFLEDAMRLKEVERLKSLQPAFMELLEHPQLSTLLFCEPADERERLWRERTRTPFSYIDSLSTIVMRKILCPGCLTEINAPLMTKFGHGYLQQNFKVKCPNPDCRINIISKNVLCVRKLVETAVSLGVSRRTTLAGTLFALDNTDELLEKGRKIKARMCEALGPERPNESKYATMEYYVDEKEVQRLMRRMRFKIELNRFAGPLIARRIGTAYHNTDLIYSVDLPSAILRQGNFVQKMRSLGWTDPDRFSEESTVLREAIVRYHFFLELLVVSPKSFIVPTLDIDLIWHTHQLSIHRYKEDCFKYIGRFIDHNDKIEGIKLASSFDETSKLWKERYGLNYTFCGCPGPHKSAIMGLTKLLRSPYKKGGDTSSSISTSMVELPADPQSTHPSDHDAVHFWDPKNEPLHSQAKDEYETLLKSFVRRVDKLKQAQDKLQPTKKRDIRTAAHEPPFVVSLPENVGYAGECVSAGTPLVDGTGGCATGNGTCGGGCTVTDAFNEGGGLRLMAQG